MGAGGAPHYERPWSPVAGCTLMRNVQPKPTLCVTRLYSHTSLDVAGDYLTTKDMTDPKGPQAFQAKRAHQVMQYKYLLGLC